MLVGVEVFVHGVLVGEDCQAELAGVSRIGFVNLFDGTTFLLMKDVRCVKVQVSVVTAVQRQLAQAAVRIVAEGMIPFE